jgi:lysophospholipase
MRALTLNGSVPEWPGCFACAMSDRAFGYTSANRSAVCQSCFDTWCWAGDDNTTEPAPYDPVLGTYPSFLIEKNLTSTPAAVAAAPTGTGNTGAASRQWGSWSVGLSLGFSGLVTLVFGIGLLA